MNLKLIDGVIARYVDVLDEGDVRRLKFFRELWGALDEGVRDMEEQSYVLPSEKELERLLRERRPVFSCDPVPVDADALVRTAERLGDVAVASGFFAGEIADALERVKWDRVIAATDVSLAGKDPVAWLEDLSAVLVDDGMTEQAAHLSALLASMALKAQLEKPASQVMRSLKRFGEEEHPLACPVCGSAPSLAHVGGDTSSAGRGRLLVCPQCAAAWEFDRVRCARCGTRNQAHLHFFNIEGDDAHRIATCDECGGYIRTLYSDDALAPCSYEVEDVVMARLDAIANDPAVAAKGREE